MTSFPRDGGEPPRQELIEPRQRGRAVPEYTEPTTNLVAIIVNGRQFGAVDVTTLKAKAQFQLERMQQATQLLDWLEEHAGVAKEDLPAIEAELGEMEIGAILDLTVEIGVAIGQAVQLSKAKRRR
jgi:hypothetical protein